jgi:predicted GNAT family N-acyltransferase
LDLVTGTIEVRRANWASDQAAIRAIREAVFVHEQGVPPELEWDAHDAGAQHVLAFIDGQSVGTGRLVDDTAIDPGASRQLLLRCPNSRHPVGRCAGEAAVPLRVGRMAVLAGFRGRGVGRALLAELLEMARESGAASVWLTAQLRAEGFYVQHGFVAEGEVFLDAGIPHRRMRRALAP